MSTTYKKRIDVRGWVLPVILIAVWFVATHWEWVDTRLIVPPSSVLESAWKETSSGSIFVALGFSLLRDLTGFFIGALAGLAFGILLALSPLANRLLGPTFHTIRQISLFAWIPLLSVWLGYTNTSMIVFIAVAAFYPVVLNTFEGIHAISKGWVEVGKVYGFSRRQYLTRLILPAASPQIFTGLHLALIYAWLATIGAEFLLRAYDTVGLGDSVIRGRAGFYVELVIFGMLVIGAVGYLINRLAQSGETYLLRWRDTRRV